MLSVLLIIFLIGVIPFGGAKLLSTKLRMPNHYWRFAWALFTLMLGLTVLGDSGMRGLEFYHTHILRKEKLDASVKEQLLLLDKEQLKLLDKEQLDPLVKERLELLEKEKPAPQEKEKLDAKIAKRLAGALDDKNVKGWANVKLGIDLRGGTILIYEVDEKASTEGVTQDTSKADPQAAAAGGGGGVNMDELCSALRRRIDPSGVEEITVRPAGPRQVEIIVPEVDEDGVASLKRKIKSVGSLEFRITANPDLAEHKRAVDLARLSTDRKVIAGDDILGWWIPVAKGREEQFPPGAYEVREGKEEGETVREVLVLNDVYDVQGKFLRDARPSFTGFEHAVHFTFNQEGANRFGRLTGANLKKHLGIILDGHIYSAPAIRSQIFGSGEITGGFKQQEVEELSSVLRSGRLPAVLGSVPASEMTTGPTLGQDTIARSSIAILGSFVIVIGIMLWFYRFSGIVACIALFLDFVLILAMMILINAAFTLPGLAGFILTLGMAVDANILIFERMREESELGGTVANTIRNGFGKAMSAIVDSNLTTLIVATILYYIGTEQIRGFAIMLWIGIVISMFTAVYVSRTVFDVCEKLGFLKELKMRRVLPKTSIPFMKYARTALMCSFVVMILGLAAVGARSYRVAGATSLLDIDFIGGVSVQIHFTEPQTEASIRAALGSDIPGLSVTNVSLLDEAGTEKENLRWNITATCPPDMEASDYLELIQELLKQKFAGKLQTNTMAFLVSGAGGATPKFEELEIPADTKISKIPDQIEIPAASGEETPAADTETPAAAVSEQPAGAETEETPDTPIMDNVPAEEETKTEEPAVTETPASTDETSAPAEETEETAEKAPETSETPEETAPAANTEDDAESTENTEDAPDAEKETAAVSPLRLMDRLMVMTVFTQTAPASAADEIPATEIPATIPANLSRETLPETIPTLTAEGAPEAKRQTLVQLHFERPIMADNVRTFVQDQLTQLGDQLGDKSLTGTAYDVFPAEKNADAGKKANKWNVDIDLNAEMANKLFLRIQETVAGTPLFPSVTTIGSQVAGNMSTQGIIALLASFVGIVLYLWFRFQKVSYGLAAVLALVHDVVITLGLIALSTWLCVSLRFLMIDDFKISLTVLASFLTLIGYSLNDKIIVFDRIREVRGKSPKLTKAMIDKSVNQTLTRTTMTSFTTLIVVIILYIFGGETIHTFSFVLMAGIVIGTYSSIFIGSPFLYWLTGGMLDGGKDEKNV